MPAPVGIFAGLCTLDVVHSVERLPAANEKVTAASQFIAAGGPATNAAVTFAALGGRPRLLTALGSGALADAVRADLESWGVSVEDLAPDRADALPVSAITVLAGTGERSVVSIDASGFAVSDIAPLDLLFDGADVALIDGHHQALSERAGRTARACRVPVVVDAGRWRPAMPSLLAGAHTVICSAEFRVPDAVDAETSARGLVEQGVPTVAVTHGGEPIDWWAGGRCGRIAPPRVDVVDTAGAGDACHGAYAYAVAAFPSSTVERRLAFAARVASLKCAFAGTRSWLTELKGRGIDALW